MINIKFLLAFIVSLISIAIFGQNSQTKTIKNTYSDGIQVFKICISNPSLIFNKKKEYFWYSESSNSTEIQSTEGGCGGNLLDGEERFYNNKGKLIVEHNYKLGLLDGETKYWDSIGRIQEIHKYKLGKLVYQKRKLNDGWVEEMGTLLTDGYIKRYYDFLGNLSSEHIFQNGCYNIKTYWEYTNKIKEQFNVSFFCDSCLLGKYCSYYNNGKKHAEGQFSDTLFNTNIKVGIWKYYNNNGLLDKQELYKLEVQKWPNKKWKIVGGYFYDKNAKKWIKTGNWEYYNEDGQLQYEKNFDIEADD